MGNRRPGATKGDNIEGSETAWPPGERAVRATSHLPLFEN
jgi:hypothetical protein